MFNGRRYLLALVWKSVNLARISNSLRLFSKLIRPSYKGREMEREKEGGRERRKEEGRERGREGGRERGREGVRKGGRE